jgi:hypothetical protein
MSNYDYLMKKYYTINITVSVMSIIIIIIIISSSSSSSSSSRGECLRELVTEVPINAITRTRTRHYRHAYHPTHDIVQLFNSNL